MITIAVVIGNVHLYIIHPLSQSDIIEKSILSLGYNLIGPDEKE